MQTQTQTTLTPIFGPAPNTISSLVNSHVVEQHIDEIAFQWWQWSDALNRPDYTQPDLFELTEYMTANLEGIYIANQTAWLACLSLLKDGDEYLFPATILAFQRNNADWQQQLLKKVDQENVDTFIGALSWLDFADISAFIQHLLHHQRPFYQYIAIAVCANHRQRPDLNLAKVLSINVPLLKNRVLQCIGELKCHDLRPMLLPYLEHQNSDYRFWAAWSLALLGERQNALPELHSQLTHDNPHQLAALQMVMRVSDQPTQRRIIDFLRHHQQPQMAIMAIGIAGYSDDIPWLIDAMTKPELARLAGEAFSMITGIDIEYHDLVMDDQQESVDDLPVTPELFDDEHDDDDVFDDDDEEDEEDELPEYEQELPIPDPTLIATWWQQYRPHFQSGVRYLMGQVIEEGTLLNVLQQGYQRQRQAAALELALLAPQYTYLNMRSKSASQPSFTLARQY